MDQSLQASEKIHNRTWVYKKQDAKKNENPVNYYVPNFGADSDIKLTHNNLKAAEIQRGHKWNVVPKDQRPAAHPTDYYVPNFGQSQEVRDVNQALSASEKYHGRKWVVKDLGKKKDHPMDYAVPNFGMDHDVVNTLSHAKAAEKSLNTKWEIKDEEDVQVDQQMTHEHGVWRYPKNFVQVESEREPLLTWAPKVKASHPMDYFVPAFGKDHDMIHA